MALQVWLPLNGDLRQQGLNNVVATANGATINTVGKIGHCYSFSGSNSISLPQVVLPSQTPAWSFACWFSLNDVTTTTATCLFSERTGANSTGYTIFIYPKTGQMLVDDGVRWTVTPMTFSASTWYHLVITRDSSGKKIYINSQLKASTTVIGNTSSINTNGCLIGLAQSSSALTTGSQGFKGKLNDVRIYNHALSEKEVKKISQGLVFRFNIFPDYEFTNLFNTASKSSTTTKYNAYKLSLKENLQAGETYTIQLYNVKVSHSAKTPENLGVGFWWGGGSIGLGTCHGTQYFTNGETPYLSHTFTITETQAAHADAANAEIWIYNSFPNTSGTMSLTISRWKLIKGTPDKMYHGAVLFDSSGNKQNGSVYWSFPTISNISPIGKNCLYYSVTNQKLSISNLITTNYNNSYTFMWWGKTNDYSKMFWGFSNGIKLNGIYQGNLWNTGDSTNNPLYNIGTTTAVTKPATNTWYHWTMVGNGSQCLVYKNGILWAQAKTYKSISGTEIICNGWANNSDYCSNNMYMADFRLYSTALSAEDILEIYKQSKIINGTILVSRDLE